MSNEEKNSSLGNEIEENNNSTEAAVTTAPSSKLSGGLVAAIIGGIAVLLVAVILLVLLLPGAPDNGEETPPTDGKVTYVVTVVDNEGNPVKDAMVFFSPKGGTAFPLPTEADGTVSYKTDKELTVSILSVPTGYEYDKLTQTQSFDKDGKLTVTVNKVTKEEGTKYLIRVVDQNGNAVAGAKVQMCESENEGVCLVPITTDENGEATYTVEEKGYKAAITSLPEGYEKLSDDYVYFVNGVAEIVVNKTAD